jgi:integrase
LRTAHAPTAKVKAKTELATLERNDWKPEVKEIRQERAASLGEILERFEKGNAITLLDPRTAKDYANTLKKVVEVGTGKAWNPAASSTVLTEQLVRNYIAKGREINPETGKPRRPDSSIRSSLTQARCVLQEHFSDLYHDLKLPDLTGFRAKKRFKPQQEVGFVPFDRQTVIDMEAAADRLWQNRDATWVCYALMSQLGLRNGEVEKALWSDFITRPVFDEKGKKTEIRVLRVRAGYDEAVGGEIEVPADLWEKLEAYKDDALTEYVVPGKNKTERANVTERQINRFVERFIPDRQKLSYELRKWAGSIVATRHGIYSAQRFLRHKSVTTTERYYATYLKSQAAATTADRAAIYGFEQVA